MNELTEEDKASVRNYFKHHYHPHGRCYYCKRTPDDSMQRVYEMCFLDTRCKCMPDYPPKDYVDAIMLGNFYAMLVTVFWKERDIEKYVFFYKREIECLSRLR